MLQLEVESMKVVDGYTNITKTSKVLKIKSTNSISFRNVMLDDISDEDLGSIVKLMLRKDEKC